MREDATMAAAPLFQEAGQQTPGRRQLLRREKLPAAKPPPTVTVQGVTANNQATKGTATKVGIGVLNAVRSRTISVLQKRCGASRM